ncbi:MAG: Opr family porin [Aliarcobacter sp.]|jgi:hypothetical protein|nr:Opr family porin [Aliarcobacter sp.]
MRNLLTGKKVSLVVSGLILSSTMTFAADTIDSAFKEGKVTGSLGIYGQKVEVKNFEPDFGYANANATLGYETASFYGISAKAEFKGNLKLGEVEKGDYKSEDAFQNTALMTEAYLKYANEMIALKAGRQAVDLEWMGDYQQAVIAEITAIADTTIVLGYSQRKAESGIDLSEDFDKFNENKGAYVADIKYAGFAGVEFNPYFYSAPDMADWYGLKTTFSAENFGLIAHYAATNEDSNKNGQLEDGTIGHVELNTKIEDFTVAVGYIKTDKDGGAGSMTEIGDNISPFEDGNYVYETDAKTIYGSLGYTIADIELGALYGQTKFERDYKEKELNLTVAYSFTDSLEASVLYADIKADKDYGDLDYNKILASVEYSF